MPERLFPFVQVELPLELGPPDGRWMLRSPLDGEVDRIVVLSTAGGHRADAGRRRSRRRVRPVEGTEAEPPTVPVTRATVIATRQAFDAQERAEAWLAGIDPDAEAERAFASIAELCQAHRIASSEAALTDPSPARALALRAGFGQGEQVANGRWLRAVSLPAPGSKGRRGRRRGAIGGTAREERLAALLAGRERALVCEELALRARRDLDAGRHRLAAIELERAYAAAKAELELSAGVDMGARVAELRDLSDAVRAAGARAIPTGGTAGAVAGTGEPEMDVQQLRHALERLEAALRARVAIREGALEIRMRGQEHRT